MEESKKEQMVIENAKIENDCIVISKKDIESWIEHYQICGHKEMEHGCPTWLSWFYWGKREVLVDLLKHFPDKESEEER